MQLPVYKHLRVYGVLRIFADLITFGHPTGFSTPDAKPSLLLTPRALADITTLVAMALSQAIPLARATRFS